MEHCSFVVYDNYKGPPTLPVMFFLFACRRLRKVVGPLSRSNAAGMNFIVSKLRVADRTRPCSSDYDLSDIFLLLH